MIKKTIKTGFFFSFLMLTPLVFAQKANVISGYIEDAASGERLISAAVIDTKTRNGTVTNTYGFFSLSITGGSSDLIISYIGYAPQTISVLGDTTLTVKLTPSNELAAVEINAKKQDRIENTVQMSRLSVPIEQIKRVPVILGETDILKVLQLMPGVKFGTEGSSGIYVRGGGVDQNLILLDGVPVYNAAHVGGLFSVFNADAIKNVTLTKGGFPARFGGRLSSVLEIDMKEGDMNTYHTDASIGLISSKITFQGPIIKDKASFIVSARRTYADLVARPLLASSFTDATEELEKFKLYFYDLNVKANYKISDKHRLFLSAYNGFDEYLNRVKRLFPSSAGSFDRTENGYNWGNLTGAFRWNWLINNKLFANTTLTYSQYKFNLLNRNESKFPTQSQTEVSQQRYQSQIFDWAGRIDFDYVPSVQHHFKFGGGGTSHTFIPGVLQVTTIDTKQRDTTLGGQRTRAFEPFLYVEDEWTRGRFKANIGFHATSFFVNQKIYPSVQPRLSALYSLPNDAALKASFCTMTQFINLLSNDGLGLPTDLWVPTTDRVKPQQAWQAALGFSKTIDDTYELSVEAYYKKMQNVISYKEGADFIGQENNWEDKVTQGKGEAYGLEVFLQKKVGKTTGWVGYTLAWNNRQFDDINRGNPFPFKYDRRHDFSIVVSHQLTRKINLSANWIFSTSNAVTVPVRVYQTPLLNPGGGSTLSVRTIYEYGDRNALRTSNFHRLDIGAEFLKIKKKYERKLMFGFYNTYNQANPFFLFARFKSENSASVVSQKIINQLAVFQTSIIPIIPYISLAYKF